jgi:hypothetical protein
MISSKKPQKYLLAPDVSVALYKEWVNSEQKNRAEIAKMVRHRFEARFIAPVSCDGRVRGGFAALALCCLAIQALQSFRSGQENSNTSSSIKKFIKDNKEFASLRGHEQNFYDNVRNSLHHQAQTKGGWRINLSGPVFNPNSLSIGAQKFVNGFRSALYRYCGELEQTTDDSPLWLSFISKMDSIIRACDSEAGA